MKGSSPLLTGGWNRGRLKCEGQFSALGGRMNRREVEVAP